MRYGIINPQNPIREDNPLSKDLVAWYLAGHNFSGFGTFTWRDIVNRHHGTLNGMTPSVDWVRRSPTGGWGSLAFDGTGDYVVIPPNFTLGDYYTISVRFRTTQASGTRFLVSLDFDLTPYIELDVRSTTARFATRDNSGNVAAASSSKVVNDGIWHTMVGRRTGTVVSVFVDGIEVGSGSNASLGTTTVGAANWQISGRKGATLLYAGDVSDVIFANRGWSDQEIKYQDQQAMTGYPDLLRRIQLPFRAPGAAPPSGSAFPFIRYYMGGYSGV